ncbi:MAG TPA: excinuclease ABC subunit UvrC [Bacillota bacterium]|nr:excinuclease ABC subunit UvrC [Bacillota bacterium]
MAKDDVTQHKLTVQQKLKLLPDKPGVYLMKDETGTIIYVGKAISLKNRVRSYFQNKAGLSAKTLAMVARIADLEYIITDSEVEALILECNLIKKHRPNYNIRLKDDKGYPYIKLTVQEEYPRVFSTRTVKKDRARYFGPFTSSAAVQESLKLLTRLFPLRLCKKESLKGIARPCLNHHIKRCLAPCTGEITRDEYGAMVREVCLFLEGKHDTLVRELEGKMLQAAEDMEFELAARYRDQINAVNKIGERQKMVSEDSVDQDVVAMARGFDQACVTVFFVRSGMLLGREHHFLQGTDEMSRGEVITAFVEQYYSLVGYVPREILLDEQVSDSEIILQWLKEKRGGAVSLLTPKRGSKKELVDMVAKNALQELEQHQSQLEQEKSMTEGAVHELKAYLNLEHLPWRMECFDISNTQGTESVASMVVFVGGKPANHLYRRFKIKTVEGPNDFASMQEVIGRRFKRMNSEQADQASHADKASHADQVSHADGASHAGGAEAAPEGAQPVSAQRWATPDLIIIDGGKGQLSSAREAMRAQGCSHIPTFGLAKEEELLFTEGNPDPIVLPRGSKALYLLQRLRDEAHRFAITYHRNLRGKRNLHSVLEDIPGIGSKRKQALYKHFGSLTKIRSATQEELNQVKGMTTAAAREVWEFFQAEREG